VKPFAIWLAGFVIVVGGLAFGYHLVRQGNPDRVFVVVDGSFEMQREWDGIPDLLDELDDRRYAEFALATEKPSDRGHTWQDTLNLGQVQPYGPRDLACLVDPVCYADIIDATELLLVTNAPDTELEGLDGWTVIRP
jgi:hypothetical protein